MYVEEVDNKYFLIKKAIYSDYTPNSEEVKNYKFWALLKQNAIKYTIDPQIIILKANFFFQKPLMLYFFMIQPVIKLYKSKEIFEAKILHKLEKIKLTDIYTQTHEGEKLLQPDLVNINNKNQHFIIFSTKKNLE